MEKIVDFFAAYPVPTYAVIFLLIALVGFGLWIIYKKALVEAGPLKVYGHGVRRTAASAFRNIQAVPRVGSSPIRLDTALRTATRSIYVAGQNLYWMVTWPALPGLVSDFLKVSQDRTFGILLCDPSSINCVNAVRTINPSDPDSGYTYDNHLQEAGKFIRTVKRQVPPKGGALSAKMVPLFLFEVMFVDPTEPDGYLAMQPIINYSHDGAERPQFIISKDGNEDIFSHYWDKFRLLFQNAEDYRPLATP